jgi:hypothetical protein
MGIGELLQFKGFAILADDQNQLVSADIYTGEQDWLGFSVRFLGLAYWS